MKKTLLPFFFLIAILTTQSLSAQNGPEVGVRLGYAAALDYVKPIKNNRFRSNLGWGIDYLLWDNFYEVVFPISDGKWQAYTGAGPGLRYWLPKRTEHEGLGFAVVGQVGIERRFANSLTVGIDWSPFYDLTKDYFNNYGTLSIRKRLNTGQQ